MSPVRESTGDDTDARYKEMLERTKHIREMLSKEMRDQDKRDQAPSIHREDSNSYATIYDFVPVACLGSGSYGDVYLVENIKDKK